VKVAAAALAPLTREHNLVITHGNGPQVGLLALQGGVREKKEVWPLDVLDAETEGMIGYLIEQELGNLLGADYPIATLLTQIEVDPKDPAFNNPSKPIGPIYSEEEARLRAEQSGWDMAPDGDNFRRVVPSPAPQRILELGVIELLLGQGVTVVCAGGGGIPVARRNDGTLAGVEAVIDKDSASALLAIELRAGALVMLTDVDAVYSEWGKPQASPIGKISSKRLQNLEFEPGSMAPKVAAACEFVDKTGGIACIGQLSDAAAILAGAVGTTVIRD
jgi:carbamate kinase